MQIARTRGATGPQAHRPTGGGGAGVEELDTPKTHKRVGAKSKAMKSQKTSSTKSSKYKLVHSKVYHQVKAKMLKGKKPTKKLLKLATEKARKAGKNAAANV